MIVAGLPMKLTAEFLGTFLLMISILASGGNAIVIGLTLALIVFLTGGISGAAVNPAVSLGLWYSGSLSTAAFFAYSAVQLIGAVAGAYFYKVVA
jgi:aquaporin Z